MKLVVQRVDKAEIVINDDKSASISTGLVALVGFEKNDSESMLPLVAKKLISLRRKEVYV